MMVVIVKRPAPEGEDRKMDQGHEHHHQPGSVFDEVAKIRFGSGFLGGHRTDPFARGGKGDQEEHQTNGGPDHHGGLPAMLAVGTDRKFGHERQGQSAHDELRGVHRDKPVGVQLGPFVHIAGHHATQRGIRHVVHRVDGHQQDVGDGGVSNHRHTTPAFGRGVGQDHEETPG